MPLLELFWILGPVAAGLLVMSFIHRAAYDYGDRLIARRIRSGPVTTILDGTHYHGQRAYVNMRCRDGDILVEVEGGQDYLLMKGEYDRVHSISWR